ncbi:hypothetical protein LP421_18750 [Rhizobium sp. RCAM05350]|nr:hypothetical protein LP421_18750 [Rhizobium sp. RCAM05350]
MLAQFFAITLINTFTWFGGQGYCAYDFAVLESGEELTDISLTLRPAIRSAEHRHRQYGTAG